MNIKKETAPFFIRDRHLRAGSTRYQGDNGGWRRVVGAVANGGSGCFLRVGPAPGRVGVGRGGGGGGGGGSETQSRL